MKQIKIIPLTLVNAVMLTAIAPMLNGVSIASEAVLANISNNAVIKSNFVDSVGAFDQLSFDATPTIADGTQFNVAASADGVTFYNVGTIAMTGSVLAVSSAMFDAAVAAQVPELYPDNAAVADTASLAAAGTFTVNAAGGVLSNDAGSNLTVVGVKAGTAADAASVGTAGVGALVAGAYGVLTLNADGSYTYAADTAAAKAIPLNESRNDVFSYANSGGGFATLTVTVVNNTAMTRQELQAFMSAQGNVLAANTVAFVDQAINGLLNLEGVDIANLTAQIQAVNDVLGKDPASSAFLAWNAALADITALKSSDAAQQTAITALQTSLASVGLTVTQLVADVSALQSTVDTIQTTTAGFVTRDETAQDTEGMAASFVATMWAGRTRPAGLPNADGTVSA